MNSSIVLSKSVAMKDFQEKDMHIRRMFIMLDGKKSLDELAKHCGISVDEAISIAENLIAKNYAQITGENRTVKQQQSYISKKLDAIECTEMEECLVKALAYYIGPVAKIIVNKTLKNTQEVDPTDAILIIDNLAIEIEKDTDRKEFVSAMYKKLQDRTNK